jgi:ABC-type multidrug transport system ATPase subunit
MLRVSQRFESYIDLFQLRPILHKKITELSSGEYQRVCLVRTLIREKPIIILDEPVAFLDTTNKKIVLDTLLSLHKKGITIIFSSHNPEDYKFFQTRVTKDFFIPYLL